MKGILCGVGRFEIKQGRKSRKVGTFGEKVGLYFSNGVGEGEKNACFPLFYVCQSRNRGELQAITPRQTDFFWRKMRFRARKSRKVKGEIDRKRWFLPPKWLDRTKKGGFGVKMIGRG